MWYKIVRRLKMRLLPMGIVLLLSSAYTAHSQAPVLYYPFDGCVLDDSIHLHAPVDTVGAVSCVCAAKGDGISIDGAGQALLIDSAIGQVLSGDFTLSFYLQLYQPLGTNLITILTNEDSCLRDSSFRIQYDQLSRRIEVLSIIHSSNIVRLSAPLDPTRCWHHIVVTRKNVEFALYINGALLDRTVYAGGVVIPVRSNQPFYIGKNPCNTADFRGIIDDVRLYNTALDIKTVRTLYHPINAIVTPDTFLIKGTTMIPQVRHRCVRQFSWSPAAYVADPSQEMPELMPDTSTTFVLRMEEDRCTGYDSLFIQVIDTADVQCPRLLLPSAFTPNGDALNDRYGISNFYIVEQLHFFQIFDRWGNVVFHTTDKNATWDGTFQGKALNPGTYAYKISYRCAGKDYLAKGHFYLLR